ncbi:hypothetical protein PIROE2DRAFT_16483 [Piromyces sp. E2]|nr:hypothetical protein PIROE2DRAFT_16483 [Piromyces sp. E2]|eukprot:OUM58280.1 hypothetical protein PIROE2DRAFT_16483 [Piromyces sp. E2]
MLDSSGVVTFNKNNNVHSISKNELFENFLIKDNKKMIIGIYIRIYYKNNNSNSNSNMVNNPTENMISKDKYISAIESKINLNNPEYIIDREDYIEWIIDDLNKLKKLILKKENDIENYNFRLCNVNSFGNIYANYVFAIRNNCHPLSFKIKESESSRIQIFNKSNNHIDVENFINKKEMISKSLILNNKTIIVGIYIRLYKKKNSNSGKIKGNIFFNNFDLKF